MAKGSRKPMKVHDVQKVDFEGDTMMLVVDGATIRVSLNGVSERLGRATDPERRFYQVSPSGYGIHWPALDEDLSVDGLIRAAAEYPSCHPDAAVLREKQE
jgi:hypothetical protein